MAKPHALRLFLHVAPELSVNEFRPIKQTAISRALGIAQQQVSKILDSLCDEGLLERGESEGTANTYKVNPAYPGVQTLLNRR
jgi:DNA-binding MarR family transcriptional regulator